MVFYSREVLSEMGMGAFYAFFKKNKSFHGKEPSVISVQYKPMYGTCAFYNPRKNQICIHLPTCGRLGTGGRAWSWPSYKIDRTPFGVICHELGHFVDKNLGYPSKSKSWLHSRDIACEKISGYEPNKSEAFAETFRVWLSNPDLLFHGAPNRYAFLDNLGLNRIESKSWYKTMRYYKAPNRQIKAAKNWIKN